MKLESEFKINNFDLLRLFAATEVVLTHSFAHFDLPFPELLSLFQNFQGVPMFFVMSGYLISASFERNSNLKNYFRNRALRIYPALWVCILVSIIVIYFVAKINFFHWQGFVWLISQCVGLIYTPGFLKNWGFGSYNGSLWTIPLELQFYIILPLIYFAISHFTKNEARKTIIIFIVFLVFTFVGYYILSNYNGSYNIKLETKIQKILRYLFISQIYLFLAGVVLQRLKAFRSKIIYGKGLVWLIVYLLFSYFMPDSSFFIILRNILLGVCTISLAYTFPGIANKILHHNDISYGTYIYHGLILGVLIQLKVINSYYSVVLVLALSYLIAFISWRLIEKPSIMKKKEALRKP